MTSGAMDGPRADASEVPIAERPFDELLAEAVRFHGHACPGQIIGVRMTVAGCRETGIERPRSAGKGLVVLVEIDRCATDAIQALTGVSLGKRTLKHLDYGKMAATFVNVGTGEAVRVSARDSARERARRWAPDEPDQRRAQMVAYRAMPEWELLGTEPVRVGGGWLGRRRVRVFCQGCEEGINYEREVSVGGKTLCRACAGERYYAPRVSCGVPALASVPSLPRRPTM